MERGQLQCRRATRLNPTRFQHSGIAYSERGARSIRQIIDALTLLNEVYDPEEMAGRLEYI
jgi:hypothetical protein